MENLNLIKTYGLKISAAEIFQNSKLRAISVIATQETQKLWAQKAEQKLIARLKVYRKRLEKEENKQMSWEDVFEKLLEEKQPKAQAGRKNRALPQGRFTPQKFSRHITAS